MISIDLISLDKLYSGRRGGRAGQRLRAQIARDQGAAVAVIHPLSSMMAIDYPGRLAINPNVAKAITRERYDAYLDRLHKYLFKLDRTVIVFLVEKDTDMIKIWLEGLEARDPAVAIGTEARNPMPLIDGVTDEEVSWSILGGVLRDAGINDLTLIGELAYEDDAGKQGCVHCAFSMLSPHIPSLRVVPELNFPNVKVPGRNLDPTFEEIKRSFFGC